MRRDGVGCGGCREGAVECGECVGSGCVVWGVGIGIVSCNCEGGGRELCITSLADKGFGVLEKSGCWCWEC